MLMPGDTYLPEAKSRLDGDDLRTMFSSASHLLERNVEVINALNVFPVPDGDTGTNMFLTMRDVMEKASLLEGASASDMADTMARAALMGARGNSGVILSQFFKGMAVGLEGVSDFGAQELVEAYQRAREHAYKAVDKPVEGTMLTVISSVAEAARESFGLHGTVQDVCEAVSAAARESVARTPSMLAVLRDAGVVDAGGQGLAVLLEGVRRFVVGESSEAVEIAPPEPVGMEWVAGSVSAHFLDETDEEMYGYCTQFLIQGERLDVDAIRDRMGHMALSTVVVGDDTMVNVHVHTDDPGPVVSFAVSQGTLSHVKIENMDQQHVEYADVRRREATPPPPAVEVAVVAVAWGNGLENLFTSLGASGIVAGGDTMNPSVQGLVEAVEAAPSNNVVLLPNNGNIVPAANQAAEYSKKNVRVVPARSIPQGISAILSFNPERDLESNVSNMGEALASVRTGEVTEAVRPATIKGVAVVEPGRLIGLLERQLVATGDSLADVVISVLREAQVSDGDLVTLYWGDRITADDACLVVQKVTDVFQGIETELVEGGQPHYHFIMSIE